MPAKNDTIFKVTNLKRDDAFISASLEINKNSELFNGHFPGHPVLPGACMLQLVKDVLADTLNTSLRLKMADQLKFIVLIDPTIIHTMQLEISCEFSDEDFITASAKLIAGEVICFKFLGTFIRERKTG